MSVRGSFAVIALAAASIGAIGTARAEDFTGFYAGVNAGYAFEKEKRDAVLDTGIARPGEASTSSLPPSALSAAKAMTSPARSASETGRFLR